MRLSRRILALVLCIFIATAPLEAALAEEENIGAAEITSAPVAAPVELSAEIPAAEPAQETIANAPEAETTTVAETEAIQA